MRWSYIVVGAIGLAFYVHRELLARFFLSLHDYQVDGLRVLGEGLVEVALRPIGRSLDFVPGKFAMVYLEAKDGWHRHPFTISSSPHEEVLRVTVKALGDYTSSLQKLVEPGMPAVIGGPHGRFSHWKGTDRQIWIAGGVGVAPFLSWLRALDGHLPHRVDFFYTADGEAPFAEEIRAIAERYESLRIHLIDTRAEGRLTPERVLSELNGDLSGVSVFMCGPASMLTSFELRLRQAGVPRDVFTVSISTGAERAPVQASPRERRIPDLVLPERPDHVDRLWREPDAGRRDVVTQLADGLRARDDGRDEVLRENERERPVSHRQSVRQQLAESLDKVCTAGDLLGCPAAANVAEDAVRRISTGKPAGVERHLDDDSEPFGGRALQRRQRLLMKHVEPDFEHLAVGRLHQPVDVRAKID